MLTHARALLTSTPEGRTTYVDADLRDADRILTTPELADNFDLSRPVAVLLLAVLHFLDDDADPYGIVEKLMAPLPSGSFLVVSHTTADFDPESWARFNEIMRRQGITTRMRSRAEVARFFTGLDLVEPGVVPLLRWRPEREEPLTDAQVALYGGVARKP